MFKYWLKYRIKRISRKKIIIWATIIFIFSLSLFSFIRYYANSVNQDLFNPRVSGIDYENGIVYVNDLESDWNYYESLNFTEVTSVTEMPGTDRNFYSKDNLVAVQINYEGADANYNERDENGNLIDNDEFIPFISDHPDERQSKLVYYKYYVIENDKVKIELIDNPFTSRPTQKNPDGSNVWAKCKGFNGWVCDRFSADGVSCEDMEFTFDEDYYLRYVTIPTSAITTDSDGNKKMVINLRALWFDANAVAALDNWTDHNWSIYTKLHVGMVPIINSMFYSHEEKGRVNNVNSGTSGIYNEKWFDGYDNTGERKFYEKKYAAYGEDIPNNSGVLNKNFKTPSYYKCDYAPEEGANNNNNLLDYNSRDDIKGVCPYYVPIDKKNIEFDPNVQAEIYYYSRLNDLNHDNGDKTEYILLPLIYYTKIVDKTTEQESWVLSSETVSVDTDMFVVTNEVRAVEREYVDDTFKNLKNGDYLTGYYYKTKYDAEAQKSPHLYYKSIETYDRKDEDIITDNKINERKTTIDGISCDKTTCENNSYVYKLIQFGDMQNIDYYDYDGMKKSEVVDISKLNIETIQLDDDPIYKSKSRILNNVENYYYLATRDTNFGFSVGNAWGSNLINKFFHDYPDVKITISGSPGRDLLQSSSFVLQSSLERPQFGDEKRVDTDGLTVYNDFGLEKLWNGTTSKYLDPSQNQSNLKEDVKYFINAECNNLKIGRHVGMKQGTDTNYAPPDRLFATVIRGGMQVQSENQLKDRNARIIVESGYYYYAESLGSQKVTSNTHIQMIYGNDYDRVMNNETSNSRLKVHRVVCAAFGSLDESEVHYHNDSKASNIPISSIIVKSGKIGSNAIENGSISGDQFKWGLYTGSFGGPESDALRTVKIEGGLIAFINGGPSKSRPDNNRISTATYMTGGKVLNIVGAGGTDDGLGSRIVSISGGTVVNSVAGGSNSNLGTGSGRLYSDTLVYIGGTAKIGTNDTTMGNFNLEMPNDLFGVNKRGSVFGAGLGRSGVSTTGTVHNSHVIINGGTINGDVYGGGNYGTVGSQTDNNKKVTTTKIEILRGEIKGSIFGGANNNGAGNTTYDNNITIDYKGGTIGETIYGGSNSTGTINGNVTINLYKDIPNVYGGGKGKDTSFADGKTVTINVPNNIQIEDIYGGSEFGKVYSSKININDGIITNIYGGGRGDSNNADIIPYTNNSLITINNGTIDNIYGGANISGNHLSSEVVINDGVVNNLYGGSKGQKATATNTSVSIKGGKINYVYGGGDNAPVIGSTSVNIIGGTVQYAIYGGGKKAETNGTANVSITGGNLTRFNSNTTIIDSYTEIFGGGEQAAANTTNVYIENGAKVYNVFGGSNISGVVQNSNVHNNGGEVYCNTYGGGLEAEVITSNNYLNGTIYKYSLTSPETSYNNMCGNAFGGGLSANVNTSNVYLNGLSLVNVYGGSDSNGTVNQSNVYVIGGTAQNVFGGNNAGGQTINSKVEIDNNFEIPNGITKTTLPINVNDVFAGSNGKNAESINTVVNIRNGKINNDVFAGGNEAKTILSTMINMYGGEVNNLYGGGNLAFIGNAIVNSNGDFSTGISEGKTSVNIVGGIVNKNVYGSSNASFVYGTTGIKIGNAAFSDLNIDSTLNEYSNIHIKGSIFAGSETNPDLTTVYDDKYLGVTGPSGSGTGLIEIDGKSYINNNVSNLVIDGSIYGSGNNSKVLNSSNIYISNLGTKNNPTSMISLQRASKVYLKDSHLEFTGMVDKADPNSYKYSLIRLDALYLLGSQVDKGTYLYLRQGATFLKSLNSGKINDSVFIPQTITGKEGNLSRNVSDNRIYMLTNKVLAVSNSAAPNYDTDAGKITGMTYLGMYVHELNKEIVRGIYDYSYNNNSMYDENVSGSISSGAYTYVYGLNNPNQTMNDEIRTNGFYTSVIKNEEENSDNKKIIYEYIGVTPATETSAYYKWVLGYEPVEIVVDLIADKYSESNVVNSLISLDELRETVINSEGNEIIQEWRDAVLTIQSVDTTQFGATDADATKSFDGLLVDKNDIPTINTADINNDGVVDANNYFALSMGTTSAGWLDNYKTNFYDYPYNVVDEFCSVTAGKCNGNQIYYYDSTTTQRNLSFWLYYSKNLDFSYVDKSSDPNNMMISMNSIYIDVEFRNPHGDPTSSSSTQPVRITVNISLSDRELDKYGGVIAPGKQYNAFQNRQTKISSNGSFSIYQSLTLDLTKTISGSASNELWSVDKLYHQEKNVQITDNDGVTKDVNWSKSYRYLASSNLMPVGTVITMLDMKNSDYYYYKVTDENYNEKLIEFNENNEVKYYLTDFIKMGCVSDDALFDDDMNGENSKKYYYKDDKSRLAIEEFIFSVDFANANIDVETPEGDTHYLFLQLARLVDDSEKVIISTSGLPTEEMTYTLMPEVSSKISTSGGYVQKDGSIKQEEITYVEEPLLLNLTTTIVQVDGEQNQLFGISDTSLDDYKLGAKLSFKRPKIDENGNVSYDENNQIIYEDVTNDLFGTVVNINNHLYYPQTDGSIRLELAGRVTNVISDIKIDVSNSNLNFGDYVLVVDLFASYDGLYYGDSEVTSVEFPFKLLNNQFGLDVHTEYSVQVTHDVNTGKDVNGSRNITHLIDVINGLENPSLKVSLERRDYSEIYNTNYYNIPLNYLFEEIKVEDSNQNLMLNSNLCNISDELGNCLEISLVDINNDGKLKNYNVNVKLKDGPDSADLLGEKSNSKWKSGTYKVVYTIYDGNNVVGSVYEYLIIRSLGANGL